MDEGRMEREMGGRRRKGNLQGEVPSTKFSGLLEMLEL